MTLFNITIGISIAVIGLVVYSALVVSGRQEQLAQRIREENKFERAPYSAGSFAFEVSEELIDSKEFVNASELGHEDEDEDEDECKENYF